MNFAVFDVLVAINSYPGNGDEGVKLTPQGGLCRKSPS